MQLYIDSTLKSEWNLSYNERICQALEQQGITCYLPQRDTDQSADREQIFKQNVKALGESTHLLVIANNETPNWGTEIGLSYGKRKIIILALSAHQLPLMAEFLADEIVLVDDFETIETYLEQLTVALN